MKQKIFILKILRNFQKLLIFILVELRDWFEFMINNGQDVFGRDLFWSSFPNLGILFSKGFYSQLLTLPHEFHNSRLPVAPLFSNYLLLLSRYPSSYLYTILRFFYLRFYKVFRALSSFFV